MIDKCPKCGAQIQATREVHVYYILSPTGTWIENRELGRHVDIRYYCDNDHPINPRRVPELTEENSL